MALWSAQASREVGQPGPAEVQRFRVKLMEKEIGMVVARDRGAGTGHYCLTDSVLVLQNENILESEDSDICML